MSQQKSKYRSLEGRAQWALLPLWSTSVLEETLIPDPWGWFMLGRVVLLCVPSLSLIRDLTTRPEEHKANCIPVSACKEVVCELELRWAMVKLTTCCEVCGGVNPNSLTLMC